jgi:Fe-S-cluster containining protein
VQDLPLVKKGSIQRKHLFTIRKGELVRDNMSEALRPTPQEMIKIKEKQGEARGCIFYDEAGKACEIYEQRPIQCAALKCWDTKEFVEVYKGTKLARKDILHDPVLLGLIAEHESRCSYTGLESHVKQIQCEGERAVESILELLKFDFHLRPFVSEKRGIPTEEMDFIFGKSLIETMPMFGLKVIREPEGTFFLTPIESSFSS